jgi:hypothetical protein
MCKTLYDNKNTDNSDSSNLVIDLVYYADKSLNGALIILNYRSCYHQV